MPHVPSRTKQGCFPQEKFAAICRTRQPTNRQKEPGRQKTVTLLLEPARQMAGTNSGQQLARGRCRPQITDHSLGPGFRYPLCCSWLQGATGQSPRAPRTPNQTTDHLARSLSSSQLSTLPLPLSALMEECPAFLASFGLRFKRRTGHPRSETRHTELHCPNHKDPSASEGSLRPMEATPFHFERLCIRVTLISKFT